MLKGNSLHLSYKGADERYDEAASQFSQEMLSGDNRRIYSSGRRWRMDLPRQQ
jgi:hypothetical protein